MSAGKKAPATARVVTLSAGSVTQDCRDRMAVCRDQLGNVPAQ